MFELKETRKTFNYPVKGACLGKEFLFVGEFKVMSYQDFVAFKDKFLAELQIQQTGDNLFPEYARKCLIRWVNLPEKPQTWICNNGQPIDCTAEGLADLLSRPGVPMAVVYEFMAAFRGEKTSEVAMSADDGLGNSQPLPDAGTTATSEPESGS